jgi:hypothetical protein
MIKNATIVKPEDLITIFNPYYYSILKFDLMSYSLTPSGVADQLAALYTLNDPALEIQADAIRADFTTWVTGHFTLTTAQRDCLNGMSANTLQAFGDMCCFGLKNRLEITFDDTTTTPAPPSGYQKYVCAENETELKTTTNGNSNGSGKIRFKAGYEPV